jgi:hypothetical protein
MEPSAPRCGGQPSDGGVGQRTEVGDDCHTQATIGMAYKTAFQYERRLPHCRTVRVGERLYTNPEAQQAVRGRRMRHFILNWQEPLSA